MTDGVSNSGMRFTIRAMEDALWQGYGRCIPSNISHDVHRPLGVTRVSSLYLSHENAYLLGRTSIPESEEEHNWIMKARTNYLNEKILDRVLHYSQDFNHELMKLGLIKKGGSLFSNGVVMYGYNNIVREAFPYLSDIIDGDGLIYLRELLKEFEYKGDGVFASKKNNLSIMIHPYLRRSLSRYNCFNKGFLKELFESNTDSTPVRIRIDLDYVGYTPSYIDTHEFDFWYGPNFNDDICQIKEGVTVYTTSETDYLFNQIKKTEFVWQKKDGKCQFEMEEVMDVGSPTLPEKTYGCRYLHSFYDPITRFFDHFDGAIRCYDDDAIHLRINNPIDKVGHSAHYTKLFRIDGPLPVSKWKSMITHYLMGNQDVYRYFGEPVPYIIQKELIVNPISKYVPFVLTKGDGIRILYSYHPQIKQDVERCFRDFDTCKLREGIVETTDLIAVDLAKCIRRAGGVIDYPQSRYITYQDNYHDLPEIYHGGDNPARAIEITLAGIKILLKGLNGNEVTDCFSFCLSWDLEGVNVKVSFMGAVPDLLKWIDFCSQIPTDRDGLKMWLEAQAHYIKNKGKDTPSPNFTSDIHDNGIFYHRRRLVQEDAELKKMYFDDNNELCANIDFADDQKELAELMNSGAIIPATYVVVEQLQCREGDYLKRDEIAILGEIDCQPTIHFINLVWASNNNGLRGLIR